MDLTPENDWSELPEWERDLLERQWPSPECSTSHPQMHEGCDGCTCSCHAGGWREDWGRRG